MVDPGLTFCFDIFSFHLFFELVYNILVKEFSFLVHLWSIFKYCINHLLLLCTLSLLDLLDCGENSASYLSHLLRCISLTPHLHLHQPCDFEILKDFFSLSCYFFKLF